MVGQDKTFVHLEPFIKKFIPDMSARDLTHVAYAYGVRASGNPDFHDALLKALKSKVTELDYPGLHNFIYYLMFRDNTDEELWKAIVE